MGLFKKKESAGCRAWHYEGIPGFAQDMPCEIDIQDDKVVFKQNDSVVNLPISKIQSCEFVKETQYMGKYHNNPVDTCKVKGGVKWFTVIHYDDKQIGLWSLDSKPYDYVKGVVPSPREITL